ncbi:MAG: GNAT family N-acetyltransferase [Methylococcaceae bacterium]
MTISYRAANSSDANAISGLIGGLSHYFLDDPASPDAAPFLASIVPEAISERLLTPNYLYILAEQADSLCGVVAIRDGGHLYHLFVDANFHGQGIARELWRRAMSASGASRFTVNSSLLAVPVYSRFGFALDGDRQTKDGVTFQPMVYAGT